MQQFVGFTNFYRTFIKDSIISPITQLARLHTAFAWTPKTQEAFEKLKNLFTSAPILKHSDPAFPYVLEVDASENAVGAIITQ